MSRTPVQQEVTSVKSNGYGSVEIQDTYGKTNTDYTLYQFNNDMRKGSISNSKDTLSSLEKVDQITLNYNQTVGGTAQTSANGAWEDIGSKALHDGLSARGATAVNDELFALISQYPNRDDGEPIYKLPDMAQCVDEAVARITAESSPVSLPTITRPTDIAKWLAAWTSQMASQLTSNKAAQLAMAAKIYEEKLAEQIKTQKEYLVKKYGEEIYNLYFKIQVEAGAVYMKDYYPCTVTRKDLLQAGISDGKAQKRNAHLKNLG